MGGSEYGRKKGSEEKGLHVENYFSSVGNFVVKECKFVVGKIMITKKERGDGERALGMSKKVFAGKDGFAKIFAKNNRFGYIT